MQLAAIRQGNVMGLRWSRVLPVLVLGGCSALFGHGQTKYSIYFQPYSVALDQQAQQTAKDAAQFARANPQAKLLLSGYSAPANPARNIDGLSDERAIAVKRTLVSDGVRPERIDTEGYGETDPKVLPEVAVRRVDISFRQ